MENQDKKLEIWKEAIPRMNEEDLEFILDFPECFESKVLKMVKARYDKLTKIDDDEEEEFEEVDDSLEYDMIVVLEEMGYKYEHEEDGSIRIFLNLERYTEEVRSIAEGVEFDIMLDDKNRNIIVNEGCWKQIDTDDDDEGVRLLEAINHANAGFRVNTFYNYNNETRMMEVYCSANFPYLPDREYLKEQLETKIIEIVFANKIINQFVEDACTEDAPQLIAEAILRNQKVN